ncbi:arylsulfatase B [Endozoicomonas arenosclerae]|uniref:arylsulfatase B n=1 Tax=Endozoicomonas arenosclerae TaxID=1633495 RepID=UPI0007865C7C|nr:arylsulfatase [Endozoicomonas arenosclerae]
MNIKKAIAPVMMLSALSASMAVVSEEAQAKQPNVVVIVADDLGSYDLGFHAKKFQQAEDAPTVISTPNLDKLAEEGVQMTRFYTSPKCTPTRAEMFTGRNTIDMGIQYATIYPWEQTSVPLSEHFMPESFQAAGYDTAMIGKWHLGHTYERQAPLGRGFDYFFGHLNTNGDYFKHTVQRSPDLQRNGVTAHEYFPDRPEFNPELPNYGPFVLSHEAVQWLQNERTDKNNNKKNPFFLYVPFKAPHSPLQAPAELITETDENGEPWETPERATYAAMVTAMDTAIGEIVEELEDQGIKDDTIIMFFSDNGGMIGSGGASNFPLKGKKGLAYDGGIRVPAIINYPKKLKPGINDQFMSAMDIFPTFATATGIEALNKKEFVGEDLWKEIKKGKTKPREESLIYGSNDVVGDKHHFAVIRPDGMKMVQTVRTTFEEQEITSELYNIIDDPSESVDLWGTRPQLQQEMQEELTEWRKRRPWAGGISRTVPQAGWRAPADWAVELKLRSSNLREDDAGYEDKMDNIYGFLNVVDNPEALFFQDMKYKKAGVGVLKYE